MSEPPTADPEPAANARGGERRGSWFLLLLPILATYLPFVGSGFRSEDFLLLRVLGERPPWESLSDLFLRGWLGIDVVRFYRPVGELLLGLERSLFGVEPLGYDLTHLALFAVCIVLVREIVRRLGAVGAPDDVAARRATVAALLFGLYPWHPNAVVWIASYANLFGNLLALAAWALWLRRGRGPGRRPRVVAALALFVAGLFTYEGVVVLPALVLAAELLVFRLPWRRLVGIGALWGVPTLVYLGVRAAAIGALLGGTPGYDAVYSSVPRLTINLSTTLAKLPWPRWGTEGPLELRIVSLLLAVLTLGLVAAPRWWRGSAAAGRVLLAAVWMLVALTPWGFRPVHPGEGRFFFLASIGFVLLVAEAVPREEWTRAGRPSTRALGAGALVAVLALGWWGLLRSLLVDLDRAAARAQAVVAAVEGDAGATPALFVADVPDMLMREGIHVQSVLRYGFRDALGPPFRVSRVEVWKVPPLRWTDSAPLRRFGALRRWRPDADRLIGIRSASEASPPPSTESLGIAAGPEGTVPWSAPLRIEVGPSRIGWASFRLFVVTPGNPTWVESAVSGGRILEIPGAMVRSMARLYPGADQFWWVEALDRSGRRVATSRAFRFRLWAPGTGPDAAGRLERRGDAG